MNSSNVASLTDLLILQSAREFEFQGGDVDEGFWIRVTSDLNESQEGHWCLVKYYESPWYAHSGHDSLAPRILCEIDGELGDKNPGFFWAPWSPTRALPERVLPMGYANLNDALQQALRACQHDDTPELNFKFTRYRDQGGNEFMVKDPVEGKWVKANAGGIDPGNEITINDGPTVLAYDSGVDGPMPQTPYVEVAEILVS